MENDLDMNSNDILNADTINSDIIILNGTQITPSGTTTLPATALTYDNTTSGLTATDVQAAIDEVDADLDTAEATIVTNTADIATNTAALATGNNHGKNLVINGDFSVWQRGTSGFTTSNYTSDRWYQELSGATSSVSQQLHTLGQTDVPGNPKYFSRSDITTGNNYVGLLTRLEDVTVTAGREITLSFWAKGINPAGGACTVELLQNFGTGGSPSSSVPVFNTDLVLTSGWVRYTGTVTMPSVSGKTLGTNSNDYLQIFIYQPELDVSTDAWNIDISNVQLEFGDTATEFEFVCPADQLTRCQRYFERYTTTTASARVANGYAESTTSADAVLPYTVTKRTIPTISFSSPTAFTVAIAGTNATSTNMSGNLVTNKQCIINATTAGLTAGEGLAIAINTTSDYIDIDAEL
jgi:hypothetical protein